MRMGPVPCLGRAGKFAPSRPDLQARSQQRPVVKTGVKKRWEEFRKGLERVQKRKEKKNQRKRVRVRVNRNTNMLSLSKRVVDLEALSSLHHHEFIRPARLINYH